MHRTSREYIRRILRRSHRVATRRDGADRGDRTAVHDYPLEMRTIGRILADKARRLGSKPFLLWQRQRYSYEDLERLTSRYANGFAAAGIRQGDHVAVMLPNCPEFLWVVWGLAKIGAVAVPLNTAARGEMLRYFLDQSDACCLLVDAQWLDRAVAVAAQLSKIRRYVVMAEAAALPDALAGVPVVPLQAMESSDESPPPVEGVGHGDAQLMLYTSGTTGPSKGVMCPQSQGHAVGRLVTMDFGYRDDDVLYTCLPLFHANAMNYTCYAAVWAEATMALSPRFSASQFWDEIRSSGATQFNALGAMTNILWKLPPGPHERDHKLRLCLMVPVPKALYRDIQERWGFRITSVFGMSENYPITRFLPDDREDKAGSAGRPLGACELRIVGDDGTVLPPGGVGELWIRNFCEGAMATGYHAMPEETERAFGGGWFRTGDRAYVDADGYMFFVDRKKEAIRRRGENISAFEVETILAKHPAVLEVAAIAVPNEMSEDDVMVYVVTKPDATLAHAEVVRFATEHMSYFMVPRFVEFIAALPKTETEKIQKYKLQQEAIARRAELWDREHADVIVAR
jgi:crotonobetaine/carnitine-CoA ligase